MATQAVQKILRVGVIQNRRVIEERLLRTREAVTAGQHLKNTFVVASSDFPEQHTLFSVKGSDYVLNFTDQMAGRISLGDSVYDLKSLVESGKAKKNGAVWQVEITDRARGKVSLGEVTFLFQFVTPPPLRVLPQLPSEMRGGLLLFLNSVIGLEGAFLAAMLFSLFAQVGSVFYLVRMVPPPPRQDGIAGLSDRFVKIINPNLEKPPEPEPVPTEIDPNAEPTEFAEATSDEPAGAPQEEAGGGADQPQRSSEEIRAATREKVTQQSALAAFYGGSDSAAGPALGLATTLSNRSTEEILASQQALGGDGGGTASRTGLGTSAGAEGGVGRVSTGSGTGPSKIAGAATGTRTEARAAPKVAVKMRTGEMKTAGTGKLDGDSIQRVVKRRLNEIQRCYERILATNPSLGGKVMLQFTIGDGGRVTDASLPTNELGSAFENCAIGVIRKWRFDSPSGGAVTARYPVVLVPGS